MNFDDHLEQNFRIKLQYNYYGGWGYDTPEPTDRFLNKLTQTLPKRGVEIMRATGATIYPCAKMSDTSHQYAGAMAQMTDRDTMPAICEMQFSNIIIARDYKDSSGEWRETENPAFIAMHELGHVIDSTLGVYVPDGAGDAHKEPSTRAYSYVQDAYKQDMAMKSEAQKLTEKFTLYRDDLLGGDDVNRDDASEIMCDLIAHELTGHNPQTFEALKDAHPHLMDVARVMITAAKTKEGQNLFRDMAGKDASFAEIKAAIVPPQPSQTPHRRP